MYLEDFEIGTSHFCGVGRCVGLRLERGGVMMVEVWIFWSGDGSEIDALIDRLWVALCG